MPVARKSLRLNGLALQTVCSQLKVISEPLAAQVHLYRHHSSLKLNDFMISNLENKCDFNKLLCLFFIKAKKLAWSSHGTRLDFSQNSSARALRRRCIKWILYMMEVRLIDDEQFDIKISCHWRRSVKGFRFIQLCMASLCKSNLVRCCFLLASREASLSFDCVFFKFSITKLW